MNPDTEAQAAMLTAVASHLTNHPHLQPVNILDEGRLQLRSSGSPGAELAEWASSLSGEPSVDVQCIHCEHDDQFQAFTYVHGRLGDLELSVWDVVPGLVDALTLDGFDATGHAAITVNGLRGFAEAGTPPLVVGDAAPALA